ncbi:GNAT family N-acetyltransferase [bacterium]|nr:GNAT family N-acetyltransferase [bacterium]
MNIYTKNLSKELWSDFERYFEFNGKCSGCWCMNHRLPVSLDFEGKAAKLAMKQLVESNRVFGVLAYVDSDDTPIGWASLDRRKTLPGHDCIAEDISCDSSIWSIHCVTVRPDYREKGVEARLMKSALALAKELKASRVESYPEPNSKEKEAFSTWNTFNGFQDKYEELGFIKIEKDYGSHSDYYYPMCKELNEESK